MFTIVISEKGGLERREAFDRGEISVGRVQGNDLMLPKGNVSKHHARLAFRDGRFVVTDLKSTNGTYVNGRKISQATSVREGDKIYIGDFVLRVEASASEAPRPSDAGSAKPSSTGADSGAPGSLAVPTPDAASGPSAAPSPTGPQRNMDIPGVSHYPLERDPDSESAPELGGAVMPSLPGPPRLPQSLEPPVLPRSRTTSAVAANERIAPPSRTPVASVAMASAAPSRPAAASVRTGAVVSVPVRAGPVRVTSPEIHGDSLREGPQQAARRVALGSLVARIVAADAPLLLADGMPSLDRSVRAQLELQAREHARSMRAAGEVPEGVDVELIARDAVRELADLGPIGPCLDDDQVTEVHVIRADHVIAVKGGQLVRVEPGFSSDRAVARIVARLAVRQGSPLAPGEAVVQRRLAGGASLFAVGPPIVAEWIAAIRRARRPEASLDDWIRDGALSKPMAAFLGAAIAARANILVIGAGAGAAGRVVAALLGLGAAGERVACVGAEDVAVTQPGLVPFSTGGGSPEEALGAAIRWAPDRLVVAPMAGGLAAMTLDAIASGAEGVLAAIGAASLRQGLGRVVGQVALARPGASVEAAREAVGESFDVVIEVGPAVPPRLRIRRIAEVVGADARGVATRDLFAQNPDGSNEPAWVTAGMSARLAGDFAARGVHLEPAVFKRSR